MENIIKKAEVILSFEDKLEWIYDCHRKIKHLYDGYIPYEFHLKLAVSIANRYKHLEPNLDPEILILAVAGHDLIEDAHVTYNDIKKVLGKQVADIIYALTNEKGKNRKERANSKYYSGIVSEPGAVFAKLCDRIANASFSSLFKSEQLLMYKSEHSHFLESLHLVENKKPTTKANELFEMITHLQSLYY